MNNINFTGIKNVGYTQRYYTQKGEYVKTGDEFTEVENEHFINFELTDDFNGNDLSEYKRIIRTTDLHNFVNPVNPNFLNIMISKDVVTDNLGPKKDYQIWINDSDRELEIKDKNLAMMSFIAKMLRKATNMPENKFVVNRDYLDSYDAKSAIIMGENLEDTYKELYPAKIRKIHSPKNVKRGAEEMNDLVKDMMFDYFA